MVAIDVSWDLKDMQVCMCVCSCVHSVYGCTCYIDVLCNHWIFVKV
jgi:hypothetical protein